MSKYKDNIIYYRKKFNLTTEQASIVCGISKEEYEKIELGFAEVTYDILSKLASYYKVEVLDFEKDINNVSSIKKENAAKFRFPKITSILLLVLSLISLVWFFAFPIYYSSFNFQSIKYETTVKMLDLLKHEEILYVLYSIIILVSLLWYIIDNIILLSSKKISSSNYAVISKITLLMLCVISSLCLGLISKDLFEIKFSSLLLAFIILFFLIFLFTLLLFIRTENIENYVNKVENRKALKNKWKEFGYPTKTNKFLIILIVLLMLCTFLSLYVNMHSDIVYDYHKGEFVRYVLVTSKEYLIACAYSFPIIILAISLINIIEIFLMKSDKKLKTFLLIINNILKFISIIIIILMLCMVEDVKICILASIPTIIVLLLLTIIEIVAFKKYKNYYDSIFN